MKRHHRGARSTPQYRRVNCKGIAQSGHLRHPTRRSSNHRRHQLIGILIITSRPSYGSRRALWRQSKHSHCPTRTRNGRRTPSGPLNQKNRRKFGRSFDRLRPSSRRQFFRGNFLTAASNTRTPKRRRRRKKRRSEVRWTVCVFITFLDLKQCQRPLSKRFGVPCLSLTARTRCYSTTG